MKPDLDRLLNRLREATPDPPRMPELEQLLWQRLANGEARPFWARFAWHVRMAAVAGAFLWGILIGTQGITLPSPGGPSGELLVEPAEFLAPDDAPF